VSDAVRLHERRFAPCINMVFKCFSSSCYDISQYDIVYILPAVAAFVATTVHQVSLRWTVSSEQIGRTPFLGPSTDSVFF